MGKAKEGKGEKTINTINVSFDNAEWEALQRTKGEQSWRKFILERAGIDSSNEIHSKGINADALRGLCLEYDLDNGEYPESHYQGHSLLAFFLEEIVKVKLPEDMILWDERLKELRKEKEQRK